MKFTKARLFVLAKTILSHNKMYRGTIKREQANFGPTGRLTIDLPPLFMKFLDAAIAHLRMHYPALVFSENDRGIIVTGDTDIDPEILRSAVLHIVYREKNLCGDAYHASKPADGCYAMNQIWPLKFRSLDASSLLFADDAGGYSDRAMNFYRHTGDALSKSDYAFLSDNGHRYASRRRSTGSGNRCGPWACT